MHFELGDEGQLGNLAATHRVRRPSALVPDSPPGASCWSEVTLRRQGDHAGAMARQQSCRNRSQRSEVAYKGHGAQSRRNTVAQSRAFRERSSEADFEKEHYSLGYRFACFSEDPRRGKGVVILNAMHESGDWRSQISDPPGRGRMKQQKLDDALATFQSPASKVPSLPTGHSYMGVTWSAKQYAGPRLGGL